MHDPLHAAPTLRMVLREQINIVARSLTLEARVVAVVLTIVSLVIGFEIANGRAEPWFDAGDWSVLGVVALVYPFAVWRRDRRFAPAFLWTLPVNRTQLVYAKVFAGWVWLMAALGGFIAWKFALSLLSGLANPRILSLEAPIGVTAFYLMGSAVLLALRHPLRWFLGAAGILIMLGLLERGLAAGPYAVEVLFEAPQLLAVAGRSTTAWQQLPRFAQSTIPTLLMLLVGCIALWAAALRHGENRRS